MFADFAIAAGWGPEKVGSLSLPQLLSYHQPMREQRLGVTLLRALGLLKASPGTETKSTHDVTPKFDQAFERLKKRTGKDKFNLHEVFNEMQRRK